MKTQQKKHRQRYIDRRKQNAAMCHHVALTVQDYYKIQSLKTKKRTAAFVRARHMASYVLWMLGVPLSNFAKYLGLHHATILLCRDRAVDFIESEEGFAYEVAFLTEKCGEL